VAAIVVIGLAVLVPVLAVDSVDSFFEMSGVDVAGGDDLAVGLFEKGLGVCRAHHAPPDDADSDAVRRGEAGGAGERTGSESSSGSGLDEAAPG